MSGSSAGGGRFAPMFQHTWHFLLFALAGFINRQQQDIIEYYREESARTYCHDAAIRGCRPHAQLPTRLPWVLARSPAPSASQYPTQGNNRVIRFSNTP